jgi:hypothetical protein
MIDDTFASLRALAVALSPSGSHIDVLPPQSPLSAAS